MSIGCATLMCHAPIVVPPIAGPEANRCRHTTEAMRDTARALVAHEPDLIVLISPHTPRRPDSWGIVHAPTLSGSFARFGHPELSYSFLGAPDEASCLADEAQRRGLKTHALGGVGLDHGALVPLHFVAEAGYLGPVLWVALPFPGTGTEETFGQAIAGASMRLGRCWAVLASGDMSHRLTHDAPAGFDPEARHFDRTFVNHLRNGDLKGAVSIDPELAELAAEDVLQSTQVALGAVGHPTGTRVFFYEGPFGVGYCEALLHSDRSPHARVEPPPPLLAQIAYDAIAHHLAGEPYTPPTVNPPWHAPRAVFVTLRSPSGELRGCIGRVDPIEPTLADEIVDCAISAATRDPRVDPLTRGELATLRIEVSVLESPKEVTSVEELDPARYGVIVSQGPKRGVLLPGVEGIHTAQDQLRIALNKAGIAANTPYRIARFTVEKTHLARN